MEKTVLNLNQPNDGEISGLVLTQQAGERPTFTFSYSKLGKIAKTKEAKMLFSIKGTESDRRSLTIKGKIKINVSRRGEKFIRISVVDGDFIFIGTDSTGTSIAGTMYVPDAFTVSGRDISIHFAKLFGVFEEEIGTIGKEVGEYTWLFKITGLRQKYRDRYFTTLSGILNVIE